MLKEFLQVYAAYRRYNARVYALAAAWRIGVRGLPF